MLGDMTSDVRFVMLRAWVALLHAEDIAHCDVHRVVQRDISAMGTGGSASGTGGPVSSGAKVVLRARYRGGV